MPNMEVLVQNDTCTPSVQVQQEHADDYPNKLF